MLPWIGQPLLAIPTTTLATKSTLLRGLYGHFGGDLRRFRTVAKGGSALHCKLQQVDRMMASCGEEGMCETTGTPCLLAKVKVAWKMANFPTVKDVTIIKYIVDIKEDYRVKRKHEQRFTPEESTEYINSLESTFNIAIPAWREEIGQDMLLTEEEREAKVATLEDFIGNQASR